MGRKVVAGYEGHLFSHGIDYRDQMARLERLLRAEPGWQQEAQRLRADYLFWGAMEEERYGQATAGWAAEAPIVAQGAWGRIYDLRAWRQQR